MPSLREKLEILLTSNGYPVKETDRSLVTTCPQCSKGGHFYIFKDGKFPGFGKCMHCGTGLSPEALVVALTGCTFGDAKSLLNAGEAIRADQELNPELTLSPDLHVGKVPLQTFTLPGNFHPINDEVSQPGKEYLLERGVHQEVLNRFDIRYCPSMQRVVFPVTMGGICVGHQARDITGTQELRYLSPQNFNKARVLLGLDFIDETKDYIILSEGPVDALRLAILQNSVCSMGKHVSGAQIELLRGLSNVKKIYLALDPDAFEEFDVLAQEFSPEKEVLIMQPPEGVKDFGEATDSMILRAFIDAKPYSKAGSLPTGTLK